MLLTNNGKLAHRLLSPARHVDKTYAFTVKFPLSAEDVAALESGVSLRNADGGTDCVTAPCRVELTDCTGRVPPGASPCTRAKYHRIKRMMEARHNQITSLARDLRSAGAGSRTRARRVAPADDAETAALENCGGADTGAPADATDVSTASRNTEKYK